MDTGKYQNQKTQTTTSICSENAAGNTFDYNKGTFIVKLATFHWLMM